MTDIAELQAILDAATDGPWEPSGDNNRVLALFKRPDGTEFFWEIANSAQTIFMDDEGGVNLSSGDPISNAKLIALAPTLAKQVIAAQQMADVLNLVSMSMYESVELSAIRGALAKWEAAS